MRCLLLPLLLLPSTLAFLSPSSCSCSCPQSPSFHCPSHSPCPPSPPCYSRVKTKAARSKREATENALDGAINIDTNCNSELLREIIVKNADTVTSVSKRQIQSAAEDQLGGRYNVICARGDFSYITNTEIFCQQTVGDVTCYAFKQLSDVSRMKRKADEAYN